MWIVSGPKTYGITFLVGLLIGFGLGAHSRAHGAELLRECKPKEQIEKLKDTCLLRGDHDTYLCNKDGCAVTSPFPHKPNKHEVLDCRFAPHALCAGNGYNPQLAKRCGITECEDEL